MDALLQFWASIAHAQIFTVAVTQRLLHSTIHAPKCPHDYMALCQFFHVKKHEG